MKISKKVAILATLATFSACSILACKAALKIRVYAFDNSKGVLYHGKIDAPDDTVPYGSQRLDDERWVAMSISDWEAVRIYCKVGKESL